MFRSKVCLPVFVLLSVPSLAQSDLHSRLRPVEAPFRDAGVLHLATGTWTHDTTMDLGSLPLEIVYSNTCTGAYFGTLTQNEVWTDEGAIPDAAMPKNASTTIPGAFNTAPGCAPTYTIEGFQIRYCSSSLAFSCTISFYDQYEPVGTLCTPPPAATASFPLAGLPAASTAGVSACWTVNVDLTGSSQSFALTGTNPATMLFGWSFSLTSTPLSSTSDGPVIAGSTASSPVPCSGTDATRWDLGTASAFWPANRNEGIALPVAGEEGSGMLTLDAFRIDGPTTAPGGAGCYFFGGNPYGSFHLELYANPQCTPSELGIASCFPAQGGTIGCPCGNNPVAGSGRGCNNSANTGGALLEAYSETNVASVSNDKVRLATNGGRAYGYNLFVQGDASVPAGMPFGDGVRCVGGSLLRLDSLAGGVSATGQGNAWFPHGFPVQGIVARSNALGQPINAGDTRHYQTYYRDNAPLFCPSPLGNTFNVTQAVQLTWGP